MFSIGLFLKLKFFTCVTFLSLVLDVRCNLVARASLVSCLRCLYHTGVPMVVPVSHSCHSCLALML